MPTSFYGNKRQPTAISSTAATAILNPTLAAGQYATTGNIRPSNYGTAQVTCAIEHVIGGVAFASTALILSPIANGIPGGYVGFTPGAMVQSVNFNMQPGDVLRMTVFPDSGTVIDVRCIVDYAVYGVTNV